MAIELHDSWLKIIGIYQETRENNPEATIRNIVDELEIQNTVETFSAIAQFKKHDGRIYGKNRDFTNSVSVDPTSLEMNHSNPLFSAHLDDIHTSHINQMITELRRIV